MTSRPELLVLVSWGKMAAKVENATTMFAEFARDVSAFCEFLREAAKG